MAKKYKNSGCQSSYSKCSNDNTNNSSLCTTDEFSSYKSDDIKNCENNNTHINLWDQIVIYFMNILTFDLCFFNSYVTSCCNNFNNYLITSFPQCLFLGNYFFYCGKMLNSLIIYIENLKQYLINFFRNIFQTTIFYHKYYLSGCENKIKNQKKFEIELLLQNPIANCSHIIVPQNKFITGFVDIYLTYESKTNKKCIIHQKEVHKYKYTEECNKCDKDVCLELIDFDTNDCDQEPSGTEITRLLKDTQLCVRRSGDCIKFILKGRINGNFNKMCHDNIKVCGEVNLNFINL